VHRGIFAFVKPACSLSPSRQVTNNDGLGSVNTLAVEEMAEMSAKIGKWHRHCLFTVNDRLFGVLVSAMSFARSPLRHLSASLISASLDILCF